MNNISSTLNTLSQYPAIRRTRQAIGQHPYLASAAVIMATFAGAAAYAISNRTATELLPLAEPSDLMLSKANVLIDFYRALPFLKPIIAMGSPIEQAVWIKNWMENDGRQMIANCTTLDLSNRGLMALPSNRGLRALPPEIGMFPRSNRA